MARTGHWLDNELDTAPGTSASTECELSGFRVSAERRGAAGARGGDFYILAARAPGHISIVIGDACGSGAQGEAQLAPILPRVCELVRSGISPARLLSELNRIAVLELPLDRFVTAAVLELDVCHGFLVAANAAHVPPLVRRADDVSLLCRRAGGPLGFSGASIYVNEEHDLDEGTVIVLMTDGVLEAIEADLLDMSTTRGLFAESAEGAVEVHQSFVRKLQERTGGRRTDDMTLVAVEALSDVGVSNANGFLQVG